jgi:DNA-binding protein Fis
MERNEAEAKLEIFRTEVQSLRDHIASPIVQRNIRAKITQAHKYLEKKNKSKDDWSLLKNVLLNLEAGLARLEENEKIYHRLLLQKEIEIKKMKNFNSDLIKNYGKSLEDSKVSTTDGCPFTSVEVGVFNRKSSSFSTVFCEDVKNTRKNYHRKIESEDTRMIDELAFYKVKHALFEENVCERDNKLKATLKKLKKTFESLKVPIEYTQDLDLIIELITKPIDQTDLQSEYFL